MTNVAHGKALDPEAIRELYTSGLGIHEVARQLHTSIVTLYRDWPADLPKRSKGPAGGRWIKPVMTPTEIVDRLFEIIDPDDLADVANEIQKRLAGGEHEDTRTE